MAPKSKKSATGLNRLILCDECNNWFEKNKKRPALRRRQPKRRQRKSSGKSRVANQNLYSRNIYKLLKCIYPDISISRMAMNVMNSFFMDLLDRIATEAQTLIYLTKKSTMSYDDIISATKLVVKTPELCDLAIGAAKTVVDWS